MRALKRLRPHAWAAVLLAALCLAALGRWAAADGDLESQLTASRWQAGQTAYAQVSAFISEDGGYTDDSVLYTRRAVDEALASAALEPAGENARLWIDAYSAEAAVTAESGYNSLSVRAVCTGGDFFRFHPPEMVSGWYYTGDEAADTLVVLDENLAWKLFGGADAAGMELYVNGQACTVAGVAALPRNEDELAAYGGEPTLYVPYSLLARQEGGAPPITCYEAVLPETVDGFALETAEAALGLADGQYELVENTGRFSFSNSLRTARAYESRAQRVGRVYYPWWENAARAAESRRALLAAVVLLLGAYPAVYAAAAGVCYGRRAVRKGKALLAARKAKRRLSV